MIHWTFWTPCRLLSSVTPERLGRKKRLRLLKDLDKSALALASAHVHTCWKKKHRMNRFVLRTSPDKSWLKSLRLSVKLPGPETIIFMTKWWSNTGVFAVPCPICWIPLNFHPHLPGLPLWMPVTTSAGSSAHGGSFLTMHQRKSSSGHVNDWWLTRKNISPAGDTRSAFSVNCRIVWGGEM